MTPIDDPRPWRDVLADWLRQRDLTMYAAARILPVTPPAIAKWLAGAPCPVERSHRALMTLHDEGRSQK